MVLAYLPVLGPHILDLALLRVIHIDSNPLLSSGGKASYMLTVRTLAKPSSPFPSSSRPQHGTLPVDPWIHRVTEMFHRLISILPSQASMWVPLFLLGLCMTINGIVFFLNESYVSWWRRKVWNHSGESGYKFDKYLMHFVVRSRGFEPPHPYGYIHLKHARLPIPPRPGTSNSFKLAITATSS